MGVNSLGAGRSTKLVIAVIVLVAFGGILAFVSVMGRVGSRGGRPKPAASSSDALLTFGAKGTGAGHFDRPCAIAIDPDGNIFVADSQDGRVQEFDSSGKFLKLIQLELDDDTDRVTVTSIATDHLGNLYVCIGLQSILKYSTKSGKLLATFEGWSKERRYLSIAVDASNNVWAEGPSDDLYELDGDGRVLESWQNLVHNAYKRGSTSSFMHVAVDGSGTVFIGGDLSGNVFVFDNGGNFESRFAVKDDDGSTVAGTGPTAVDGHGRVWVSHYSGISAYDSSGTFIKELKQPSAEEGAPVGIAFDAPGNLFMVTADCKVLKYKVD